MDTLTQEQRSERMSRVQGKDTKPELCVRRLVHAMGFRYRLHYGRIPGRPDLAFPGRRKVIFVHGCFWHRHRGCNNCTTPTHWREWWLKKLNGNAARDKLHQRALGKLGWRPIVIWECQTEKPKTLDRLIRKLSKLIS